MNFEFDIFLVAQLDNLRPTVIRPQSNPRPQIKETARDKEQGKDSDFWLRFYRLRKLSLKLLTKKRASLLFGDLVIE